MERGPGAPDERREPILHQPADPMDLRRHPPRDASCTRVRGMVRDYADGDLEDALRQAVDLHVHACRDCGLALARAEHEVLRLRRAAGLPPVAPPGFSQRTVQRLLVELSGARPSVESGPASAGGPGPREQRRRYLAGSLALAAAVLVAACVLFSAYGEIEKRSGALIATARGVSWESSSGSGLLADGQSVPEGCTLVVEDAGNAALLWRLQAGNRQPTAVLHLSGGSRLEVLGDEPRLLRGTAELEVHRPFALQVGDAARVKLAPGHYHLDAEEFRAFDDQLEGRAGSLRVRVETLQGQASIARGGQAAVAVGMGQVAVWQGFTAIVVDAAPDAAAVVTGLGGVPRTPSRRIEQPALQGTVVESPAGRPSSGALVMLLYGSGGLAATWSDRTDETGMFQMPQERTVDTGFVVAQLIPPGGRSDLGIGAPTVVPVIRNALGARLPEPLTLGPSPVIQGTVRDTDQRALAGARVVPCLIDELFGAMLPWVEGAVVTDARGSFALHGLPARLGPYSRLGLLVLHPEVAACCVPLPAPASLAAQECQFQFPLALELLAPVGLQRLPPAQALEILEELPGAPAGSVVRRHQVTADHHGTVALLRVGPGPLWLRGQAGLLRRLVPADPSPVATTGRVLVPDEPVEAGAVLRPMLLVPGTAYLAARSFRGERFAVASPAPPPGTVVTTIGAFSELTARPHARAQLFSLARGSERARAATRLLGVEDGSGAVPAVLLANEQLLLAMADDSSIGLVDVDQARTRVVLSPPGAVLLGETARPHPALRQVVPLRFTPRSGLLQRAGAEFVRFACMSEGWIAGAIPAGEYEVTMLVPSGRTWNVTVPAGQQIPLH